MTVSILGTDNLPFAIDVCIGPEQAAHWLPGTNVLCTLRPLIDAEARPLTDAEARELPHWLVADMRRTLARDATRRDAPPAGPPHPEKTQGGEHRSGLDSLAAFAQHYGVGHDTIAAVPALDAWQAAIVFQAERDVKLCEGNVLTDGGNGMNFRFGWGMATRSCANAIRLGAAK